MGRLAWSKAKVPLNTMVQKGTLELLEKMARKYDSDIGSLIDEAIYEYDADERHRLMERSE